ncbi:MAG: WYL domain-containing protein [Coriobacteriales bacterium]|nr:WYL domain-containing protein [Coriobacteriales bacterium]
MTKRSVRSGRKDAVVRIRELVALLGSLSKEGDSVTLDAISSRLGISYDDAKSLMDIVCSASGEESSGLLISANDELDEFTLQYPNVHGRPIRLTSSETVALENALNRAGVSGEDPLRQRLSESFASQEVQVDLVRRALGVGTNQDPNPTSESLHVCAQSVVDGRELMFDYRGLRDQVARSRRACVRSIYTADERWYAEAIDLDLDELRTFRLDRMEHPALGAKVSRACNTPDRTQPARTIRFTLADESYLSLIDWHDLRVIRHITEGILCEIPYYGNWSEWLIRRIAACGDKIHVEDERINQIVREYIERELDNLV